MVDQSQKWCSPVSQRRHSKIFAPGVYVEGNKIASIGLRVSRGKTYHGISLNVDMDLEPFTLINPCGYEGLKVVQIKDFNKNITIKDVEKLAIKKLENIF